jgi:hypothetical protein
MKFIAILSLIGMTSAIMVGQATAQDLTHDLRVPVEHLPPGGCRLAPFPESARSPFLPLNSNPGLVSDSTMLDFLGSFTSPALPAGEIDVGYVAIYREGQRGKDTGVYALRLKPGFTAHVREGSAGDGPGGSVVVKGRVVIIVWTNAATPNCREAIYGYLAAKKL